MEHTVLIRHIKSGTMTILVSLDEPPTIPDGWEEFGSFPRLRERLMEAAEELRREDAALIEFPEGK